VLVYYALAFALSWLAMLAVIASQGFPIDPAQLNRLFPVLIVAMLLGPVTANLPLTGVVDGRTGYRDLLARLLKWRVGISWFSIAVLMAPVLLMVIPLVLSIWNPEFTPRFFTEPNKRSLLQLGIAAGLAAGIFEELGWTGFAVPKLRLRFGVLSTGVIVGFLWGAWHIPVIALQSNTFSGALAAFIFAFG
jgi:membrane protease YdiL (CAAX protease family)